MFRNVHLVFTVTQKSNVHWYLNVLHSPLGRVLQDCDEKLTGVCGAGELPHLLPGRVVAAPAPQHREDSLDGAVELQGDSEDGIQAALTQQRLQLHFAGLEEDGRRQRGEGRDLLAAGPGLERSGRGGWRDNPARTAAGAAVPAQVVVVLDALLAAVWTAERAAQTGRHYRY